MYANSSEKLTVAHGYGNPFLQAVLRNLNTNMRIVEPTQGSAVTYLESVNLDATGFALLMWMMGNIFDGYNGDITPDVTDVTVGAPASVVFDLTTLQASPCLFWTIKALVPHNTVVKVPYLVTALLNDRAGNAFRYIFQVKPPEYSEQSIDVIYFSHGEVGGDTCLNFPRMDTSGIPVPQDTGAYIPGGQIPAATITIEAPVGTFFTIEFGTPTHPDLRKVWQNSPLILVDAMSGMMKHRMADDVKAIEEYNATGVYNEMVQTALFNMSLGDKNPYLNSWRNGNRPSYHYPGAPIRTRGGNGIINGGNMRGNGRNGNGYRPPAGGPLRHAYTGGNGAGGRIHQLPPTYANGQGTRPGGVYTGRAA